MRPRVLFFGCCGGPGHFLYAPSGHRVDERTVPWRSLYLAPGARAGEYTPVDEQVEGLAILHHLDGWTAVGWWDRSADRRHGSVAVFFVQGMLGASGALAEARAAFPHVFARMAYPIRVLATGPAVDDVEVTCALCAPVAAPGAWMAAGHATRQAGSDAVTRSRAHSGVRQRMKGKR